MLYSLKNLLVPTEENQKEPFLLSFRIFVILLALGIAMIFLPFSMSQYQLAMLIAPLSFGAEDLIQLTNEARINVGLSTLKENNLLTKAADAKVADMITKGYFAHTSPDNKTPFDFIRETGYNYYAAGENLALDFVSVQDVQNALMESSSHRANILNKLYTDIGVAVVSGVYQNHSATFVVEYFGMPLKNKTQPSKTTTTSTKNLPKLPVSLPQASTTVLGEQDSTKTPAVENGPQISNSTFGITARYFSFGLIFLLIVSFVLSMLRKGKITPVLITRTLMLLIIFGYIGFYGIAKANFSTITPVSFFGVNQSLE
ncbi:MAG: CAP domain-containing protein [Candidatus Paceibacterota bacterium]|jgi:hypothetical protein